MFMRQQQWAQQAYEAVKLRKETHAGDEYTRICRMFPALIHTSGLCQAIAFVQSKATESRGEMQQYLDDLAQILGTRRTELACASRQTDVLAYQRLTQEALSAATWLKRYAEALLTASGE